MSMRGHGSYIFKFSARYTLALISYGHIGKGNKHRILRSYHTSCLIDLVIPLNGIYKKYVNVEWYIDI